MDSFAEIPAHVRGRVQAGEPILLIMLDAFGMVFLQRHLDHPLIRRLATREISSQIPSTTTAHVTTLHYGLGVAEHGLYEWNLFEPALGTIINPLPFRVAGDTERETLAGRLDPRRLLDAPTFYETLGVPSTVSQPRGLENSSYSRLAAAGATLIGIENLGAGVRELLTALAQRRIGYGHVYWPAIDTASHHHGPDAPEVTAVILEVLDALEAAIAQAPAGVTVLITADHGQLPVSPQRLDFLDQIWPQLPQRLTQPWPAGSPRDVFLHVRPDAVDEVIEELGTRLQGRAEVRRAETLFEQISPRLAARLADVVVLPAPGRSAWLSTRRTSALEHLGTHGGLTWAETATHLSELRT